MSFTVQTSLLHYDDGGGGGDGSDNVDANGMILEQKVIVPSLAARTPRMTPNPTMSNDKIKRFAFSKSFLVAYKWFDLPRLFVCETDLVICLSISFAFSMFVFVFFVVLCSVMLILL